MRLICVSLPLSVAYATEEAFLRIYATLVQAVGVNPGALLLEVRDILSNKFNVKKNTDNNCSVSRICD